jgi:FixJ family two-component response regulator
VQKQDKKIEPIVAVVDDSDYSRRQIVSILENNNIKVAGQASSAEEGLTLSATTEANIFLIDLVMPVRSGFELAKIISEKGMGIYIIIMSSVDLDTLVIESISSGALDFLSKPFSEQKLIRSIQKIHQEMLRE